MKVDKIPFALFNCPIKFNPYQYSPYYKLCENTNNSTANDECENITQNKSLYIADEVGLGKTIEAGIIIKQKIIENPEEKFLIIAPKFLCKQWKEQLNNLFDINATILEKGVIYNTYHNVFILPLSQINKFYSQDGARNVKNNELAKVKVENIIIDEAHYFRSGIKSRRYQSIHGFINNFTTKILMSATPINNYGRDWLNQEILLGDYFNKENDVTHSKKCEAFPLTKVRNIKTVFVELNDIEQEFYDTTDKTSDEEFGKTIYRHIGASSLYALNNCYENNGLVFDIEYDDIFDEFIEEMDTDEAEESYTDNPKELEDLTVRFVEDETKLTRLIEEIEKSEFENKKIIIFAHYIETCNCIYDKLKGIDDINVFVIKGKMSFKDQDDVKKQFERAKGKNILVCSDVCKEGVNLQCASVLINYDLPFNPAIVEQRIGRVDRVGQKNDIYIYNFVVEGTYDDTVYWEFLLGKLSIINTYAKLGVINEINITDKNNFINDFKKSINNVVVSQNNNIDQLKYIYNTLRKSIRVPKENNENIDIEFLKEKINDYLERIVKSLKQYSGSESSNTNELIEDIKQYNTEENIIKHKEKLKEISQRIFKDDNIKGSVCNFLEEQLGNSMVQNPYKFKVNINSDKVRESFINEPDDRIFLRPVIKNVDEVYGLLENSHDLIERDKIEVKENIEVSFEYLNPEINYDENVVLPEWEEYCKGFIPLCILKKMIKVGEKLE